jgi:GNAT superfamily N-acetyltransferase
LDAIPGSQAATRESVDSALLDNPILNALLTDHRALALVNGNARRYPADIGPLSGIPDQTKDSYEELRSLAGSGGVLALFLQAPPAPAGGFTLIRTGLLSQMLHCGSGRGSRLAAEITIRQLAADDVPAMLELAELTEPGPFRTRTIELGNFYGIFESDRLLAMAGQRISLPGFVEVSAVCTHPDARGRGYAGALMTTVVDDILRRGKTPFLHTMSDNHSAIRVYESLGFRLRRTFHLAVVRNDV